MSLAAGCASRSAAPDARSAVEAARQTGFYVPENPKYTIFDSSADSLRFTLTRCMSTYKGHACSTSSFVDPDGRIMDWHDFGPLEGPGWASNAVGGAYELIRFARFSNNLQMERTAISILDHVLENGFVDRSTGLIRGYRHVPSGWFPRRCTVTGTHYTKAAEGGNDKFFSTSADGLFILQLWAEMLDRGFADYRQKLRQGLRAFMDAGGLYASINHDTYDAHENVAYSVAFRVFRRAGQVLNDPALNQYALTQILPNLDRFKMHEDRNGVATRGLLWMEDSWDTSYLWENAEASIAHLEAYTDTRNPKYLNDGLTILRAAAKHHYGPYGFLTEGVDWNNHVGQQHHIDGAKYGAIKYTEPFLNNQHIVEPTLYFLENHAQTKQDKGAKAYLDHEGNVVARVKVS
jgi:hypothetical protein